MNNSILTSVKKLIGPGEEDESFDTDIIIHINTVFGILNQMGIGPVDGFTIQDKSALWTDFLPSGKLLEFVKTYVYLKVKLVFDPPLSSSVLESMNSLISELEWRITNSDTSSGMGAAT